MALTKLNPAPNQTPNATNGWNNFGITPSTPQNRWEVTGKVTYAFNDNNKLWGTYAYQTETDDHPLSIWWAPESTIPYPSEPIGKETANVYLANFTHVFNATRPTNSSLRIASSSTTSAFRIPVTPAASNWDFRPRASFGASKTDQIPNFTGGWTPA